MGNQFMKSKADIVWLFTVTGFVFVAAVKTIIGCPRALANMRV